MENSATVSLSKLRLHECDRKQVAEFVLPECRAISAPQLLIEANCSVARSKALLIQPGVSQHSGPNTPSPKYGSLLRRTLKGSSASKRKFYDSGEAMLLQQGRPLDDTVASGMTLDQLQSLPKVYRTRFA